jgi:hypothetical protein
MTVCNVALVFCILCIILLSDYDLAAGPGQFLLINLFHSYCEYLYDGAVILYITPTRCLWRRPNEPSWIFPFAQLPYIGLAANLTCYWNVNTSSGMRVKLSLTDFQTNCDKYEFVEIYDGAESQQWQVLLHMYFLNLLFSISICMILELFVNLKYYCY